MGYAPDMRKFLAAILILLVALGVGLSPFHHHVSDQGCDICKVLTASGPAPGLRADTSAPLPVESCYFVAPQTTPAIFTKCYAPLRAPPAA